MKLLIMILSMLLTACALDKTALLSEPHPNTSFALGTLADANDPYDMESAPIITKVSLARKSALNALRSGKIDRDKAQTIQDCADATIKKVNDAYAHKSHAAMIKAKALADRCTQLLEGDDE